MKFEIEKFCPIRDFMTISRSAGIESLNSITYFSLGRGTSISQESYDSATIYIGACGTCDFVIGLDKKKVKLGKQEMLIVPPKTLCGVECKDGSVYTEIIIKEDIEMNDVVRSGEIFKLKDLIAYEEGCIANLDIVKNETMKYMLMAFDAGTGLTPHRAPGNAILFALEGNAVIGYEGKEYAITEGEVFRFEKNALHSVTADGKFKMAILLVIE